MEGFFLTQGHKDQGVPRAEGVSLCLRGNIKEQI
jgi:hypothetical protein